MIDLYHGTTFDIENIDLNFGRPRKDFGCGFYLTIEKQHATLIAKRNKNRLQEVEQNVKRLNPNYVMRQYYAYVYNLEFDDTKAVEENKLKIKTFKDADEQWLRFICLNRFEMEVKEKYDIIIGPTADAFTVSILYNNKQELINSNFSKEICQNVIEKLKPEKLPKQYCFLTNESLKYLKFKKNKREEV